MGSYYDLRIANFSVLSGKYRVDPEVLSIFVESDKTDGSDAPQLPPSEEEDSAFHGYCHTALAIGERLDLMGFTEHAARLDFGSVLANELQEKQQSHEIWLDQTADYADAIREKYEEEIRFLSNFTFDDWLGGVRGLKEEPAPWKGYDPDLRWSVFSRTLHSVEAHILNEGSNDEHPVLGFYCSDLRFLIRAHLLCAEANDQVVLETTDMVDAGYFSADTPLIDNARAASAESARTFEKVLILTEGKTDSRILRETAEALYPHLREFLSFLDYDQFAVPGGAGNLLNLLQGFAGAGVSNRVVALFDNDTAGTIQLRKAGAMTLPANFRVLQLPTLAIATNYPTVGPTGLALADINGLACSIELYLGESALKDQAGAFVPVQWTGYERSLSRYQGELIDKRSVQDRYLELLRCGKAETSDVDAILKLLFRAFH